MAESQNLPVFPVPGQSEFDAQMFAERAAVERFHLGDVADARREQVDEAVDVRWTVAGRFAFDEFANQRDDVLLVLSRVAEIGVHRMAV